MVSYHPAAAGDSPVLRALWKRCFEESEQALDCLFADMPELAHIYKATDGDTLIAAVYLADCTLAGRPAHYLCGVATLPEYRRKGVMTALMAYALDDAKRRGDCCSVLLPADDHLYRYYARLGYERRCTAETVKWTADELKEAAVQEGTPDFEAIQAGDDSALCWSETAATAAGRQAPTRHFACMKPTTIPRMFFTRFIPAFPTCRRCCER